LQGEFLKKHIFENPHHNKINNMQLFATLQNSITNHSEKNAFYIGNTFYNYASFAQIISRIRKSIALNIEDTEKNIGVVANDDIETYAAIIALWFEGKAYVPLSPEMPADRNELVIKQAFIKTIIDSGDQPLFSDYKVIESKKLADVPLNLIPNKTPAEELAYILFTSGTTGQPKGVPISRANLSGFIDAFWEMGFVIDEKDKCLQMFELTFDLSVMSYLVPLVSGSCIYTIPKDKIKYSYIFELLEDQNITVALMVPSILHYLRKYFDEIHLPLIRYSMFCGEALALDITEEWSKCLPNAKIQNVYGPTEDTIFCTYYTFNRDGNNKSHNGILSIGKAMEGTMTVIIDEDNKVLPVGSTGQLCLAGVQLTPGYWHNEEKNKEAFFSTEFNKKKERFYKTGDLCKMDEEGDLLYVGRADSQVKIQGFRVELAEIEFHAKMYLQKINVAAVAFSDVSKNKEIGLAIESKEMDTASLLKYMKAKMPLYMIPKKIIFIEKFALNTNGKTDRKKLEDLLKSS
jgi:D-alanine--poly(phosphoribitol) ligase subunit 1